MAVLNIVVLTHLFFSAYKADELRFLDSRKVVDAVTSTMPRHGDKLEIRNLWK
jgi:hypothetical protein